MPVTVSYPGVYIEEVPSGVRTITGVATSITAFIGRARRGPTNRPRLVQSFAEFERVYGGLWSGSLMSYAVQQYFLNGGRDALICRVHNGAAAATLTLAANFDLLAANEGEWGEQLRARVDHGTRPLEPGEAADSLFNLSVKDTRDRHRRAVPQRLDRPGPPALRRRRPRRRIEPDPELRHRAGRATGGQWHRRRRAPIRSRTTRRRRRSATTAATATRSATPTSPTPPSKATGAGCGCSSTPICSTCSCIPPLRARPRRRPDDLGHGGRLREGPPRDG